MSYSRTRFPRTLATLAGALRRAGSARKTMVNGDPDTKTSDSSGREFGPYTVIRRLGVGGMAETFEAVRGGPGGFSQRVCLKLVLPFFRGRQDFLEAFEREARLAARLRHSNIVGVIDFGQIDDVSYIALELIDGVDLAALLDAQPSGRLSPGVVALLGHELAAALEHAHDPRPEGSPDGTTDTAIIHRDISPSNVLVSRQGEVLLTDFGVAKAITGTARQQSAVKGKVPYMSPEHLRAETIDGRADLFSLGVVLYEALAGRRPFVGGNDPATILMILNGERPSLSTVAPGTPPELCEVVERLLEPNRDDRPATASELRDQLHGFLPPPRSRRELGQMAADVRGSLPPLSPKEPTSGVNWYRGQPGAAGDAPTSRAPGLRVRTESNTRRRIGALIAVLAVVGALVWWGVTPPAQPPAMGSPAEAAPEAAPGEAGPVATPETDETRPKAEVARPAAPGESEAKGAPPIADPQDAKPATPARLSVEVFPWGNVWINGRPRGAAPLKNIALKPGKYRVSVGRESPSETRVVRLRTGQRSTVRFDLTKPASSSP